MSGRSILLTWGLPAVGAVALLAGAGLVVKNRPVAPEERPPRQPTTAPPTPIDAAQFIGAIGISEPPGEAIAIAAHTAGIVTSVDITVGQTVARNQTLFQIDPRRAESELLLRRTRRAVAHADLQSLRAQIPTRRAELRSAHAAFDAATSRVAAAEADLADRQNQLRIARSVDDPRAISTEENDRRRFAALQAEARRDAAQAEVAETESQIAEAEARLGLLVITDTDDNGPELIAAAERVVQAEREVAQAQVELDLLSVKSPVDGSVLQLNTRPGEFAPASVPDEGLVVVAREGIPHLRVEIDEVDIPRFSTDARAWASPRGDANRRFELTTVLIEPLVVPKTNLSGRTSELIDTRVLQVVYRFNDDAHLLAVGQQFDVYILANPTSGSDT